MCFRNVIENVFVDAALVCKMLISSESFHLCVSGLVPVAAFLPRHLLWAGEGCGDEVVQFCAHSLCWASCSVGRRSEAHSLQVFGGAFLQACRLLSVGNLVKIKVLSCGVLNLQGISLLISKLAGWEEGFFTFTRCYSNLCGLVLYNVSPKHEILHSDVNCTFGKMQLGLLYDDTPTPECTGAYR